MPDQGPKLDLDSVDLANIDTGGSETAFAMLFQHSPVPMSIYHASNFRYVAVNDAACSLYGFERADLLKLSPLDIRLEEDQEVVRAAMAGFGDSYRPHQSRIHAKANGDRIRILTFAQRVFYGGGDCIVEWNIDVTEGEQSSLDLKGTQIFLDAVVESIPSMVFVKDALDGRFVLLNKAGELLLDLSRSDLIGKTDFDLFDPEDAERFRLADQAVVAHGQLVTIENEPLTTPKGIRSLRTQKVGVPDINGNPRYLLGISEDVTEKLRVEERSRHLASHDVLTDLPNRMMFQNVLGGEMEPSERELTDFALLLLDLDRFKAVNDRLGHHAGDELLRQVASRMNSHKGEHDLVARLGGDEFGILHRGSVSVESASRLAGTLISVLCEPFFIDGNIVSIGCSAGIALNSKHGDSADGLMKRADLALYAAKTTGKGDYAWFEFSMEQKADRQRILRDELSIALAQDQLFLHYQPIVGMRSGRIVCCEALLRWHHPTRGVISPAEFIPVAEASGLIEPIGRWVLQEACREAAKWPDETHVAVNLSPRQFSGNLVTDLIEILKQSGLQSDRLELEITESIFLTDSQENVRILSQLKQLGIRIALDDFGTGYSSLAYLRRVSFDKLKIDRSFITDLATSQENLAIVRAVIGLGKSFGAKVTAEGVETEQEYECLIREGCDQVQGYLVSRPVPAEAIRQMLPSFRYKAAP